MVIGKVKPVATVVAQFAAGVEVDAIQHEGKMFLPVLNVGDFSSSEDAPEKPSKTVKKSEPAPEPEDDRPSTTSFSKEELSEMDVKELTKILKNDLGINPDDFDGKNTNKKLRDLILGAQKEKKSPAKEPVEDAPKKGKKESDDSTDDIVEKVGDILEEFDAGTKNKKKTIAALLELSEDADEDKISELVEEFDEDGDANIDDIAEKIADALSGTPKKGKAASPKKGKKEKEVLIDPEDLEVGDRVSVWWDDDNQEWFDGKVKSIKKGKVVIAYDDKTEAAIDPDIHTKIKELAD